MNEYVHDGIVGCPDTQADYWEMQHFDDNCATTAEGSIIKQFGYDYDQDQFAYISAANGWYAPGGGTSPEDVGNMMDLFNIPNHTVQNAGVADLIAELSQGHGVIVGVRSEQLWDQGLLAELKIGTFNATYEKFFPPLFSRLETVDVSFCDSKGKATVRMADFIANHVYNGVRFGTLFTEPGSRLFLRVLPPTWGDSSYRHRREETVLMERSLPLPLNLKN